MTSGPEKPNQDPLAAFGAMLGLPAAGAGRPPVQGVVRAMTTAERAAVNAQNAAAITPTQPITGSNTEANVSNIPNPVTGPQASGGFVFNMAPPTPPVANHHRFRTFMAVVLAGGLGSYGWYAHDHHSFPFQQPDHKSSVAQTRLHSQSPISPSSSETVIQSPTNTLSTSPTSTEPLATSSAPASLPPGGVLPVFQPQAIPTTEMVDGQIHNLKIPIIENYTVPGDKSGKIYVLDTSFSILVSDGTYTVAGQAPVTGDPTKDALTYDSTKSGATGLSIANFNTLTPDGKPSTFTTSMTIDNDKIGVAVPKLSGNSATMGTELSNAFAADFTPSLHLSPSTALALYYQVVGNPRGTTAAEKTGQTVTFLQDAKAAVARLVQQRFANKFAQIYQYYVQQLVVQQQAAQQIPSDYTKRDTFSFTKIPDMTAQFPLAATNKSFTVDIAHAQATATDITAASADGKIT